MFVKQKVKKARNSACQKPSFVVIVNPPAPCNLACYISHSVERGAGAAEKKPQVCFQQVEIGHTNVGTGSASEISKTLGRREK